MQGYGLPPVRPAVMLVLRVHGLPKKAPPLNWRAMNAMLAHGSTMLGPPVRALAFLVCLVLAFAYALVFFLE